MRHPRGWRGDPHEHALAARGISVKQHFVGSRFDFDDLIRSQPRLQELAERLLSIGGSKIGITPEEDLEELLERGEIFGREEADDAQLVQMERSRCHTNAAEYIRRSDAFNRLYTGWALSEDGVWRQHSWVFDLEEGTIIETTEKRIAYFGFDLTDEEARDFIGRECFI